MDNDVITKQCERCGDEVQVPSEYPEEEYLVKLYQVTCKNNCKTHTYDYGRMKWWR